MLPITLADSSLGCFEAILYLLHLPDHMWRIDFTACVVPWYVPSNDAHDDLTGTELTI